MKNHRQSVSFTSQTCLSVALPRPDPLEVLGTHWPGTRARGVCCSGRNPWMISAQCPISSKLKSQINIWVYTHPILLYLRKTSHSLILLQKKCKFWYGKTWSQCLLIFLGRSGLWRPADPHLCSNLIKSLSHLAGGRRVWNGKSHSDHRNPSWGFAHVGLFDIAVFSQRLEACFDHPISLPQKEWVSKNLSMAVCWFKNSKKWFLWNWRWRCRISLSRSQHDLNSWPTCPRRNTDEKPSMLKVDTFETSGNPQFKGVDEPWIDPSCFMLVGKVGYFVYLFRNKPFLYMSKTIWSWKINPRLETASHCPAMSGNNLGSQRHWLLVYAQRHPGDMPKNKQTSAELKSANTKKKTKPNAFLEPAFSFLFFFSFKKKKMAKSQNHQICSNTPSLLKTRLDLYHVLAWCLCHPGEFVFFRKALELGSCMTCGDGILAWEPCFFQRLFGYLRGHPEVLKWELQKQIILLLWFRNFESVSSVCHVKSEKTAQKKYKRNTRVATCTFFSFPKQVI